MRKRKRRIQNQKSEWSESRRSRRTNGEKMRDGRRIRITWNGMGKNRGGLENFLRTFQAKVKVGG